MALISDLKEASDGQLQAAQRLVMVARELNAIRRRLEEESQTADAQALANAIQRLTDEIEFLTASARRSGRGLVDAIRSSW
jgi:molecular chaperone GrpE (heat shock protein)